MCGPKWRYAFSWASASSPLAARLPKPSRWKGFSRKIIPGISHILGSGQSPNIWSASSLLRYHCSDHSSNRSLTSLVNVSPVHVWAQVVGHCKESKAASAACTSRSRLCWTFPITAGKQCFSTKEISRKPPSFGWALRPISTSDMFSGHHLLGLCLVAIGHTGTSMSKLLSLWVAFL